MTRVYSLLGAQQQRAKVESSARMLTAPHCPDIFMKSMNRIAATGDISSPPMGEAAAWRAAVGWMEPELWRLCHNEDICCSGDAAKQPNSDHVVCRGSNDD